jgi:hypothetical protein
MKILIKEIDKTLQLEQYNEKGEIETLITGLQSLPRGTGYQDVLTYGIEWGVKNADNGILVGYSQPKAQTMINNEAKIIAEYEEEKKLILYIENMKQAGRKYFGV